MLRFSQVSSLLGGVMVCLSSGFAGAAPESPSGRASAEPRVRLHIGGEIGRLEPLYHRLQFGLNGMELDSVQGGEQDVSRFSRLSLVLELSRHRLVLVYQPLELETRVTLAEPVTLGGLTFAAKAPLDLKYGLPFYRASYLYEVVTGSSVQLALGGGLQVMDATVTLTSAGGAAQRSRSLGPLPLLQVAFRHELGAGWFWGAEAAGFYAPISYLSHGDVDVMGAFIDASLRLGHQLGPTAIGFVNVRWLGGGAEGTLGPDPFDDGYEENWLHFLTLSVGIQLEVL